MTGADLGFENTIVDLDGRVEIDVQFAGQISNQRDGDGYGTPWWLDCWWSATLISQLKYWSLITDYYLGPTQE